MQNIEIRKPRTAEEFEHYYDLRWKILRQPWNQQKGSEKDDIEEASIHIAAFHNDKIVGCGRGHFNSTRQAQIRWMAVDDAFQGFGLGKRILAELEERLFAAGAKEIILKAREKVVPLYLKKGYMIYKKGELLFGEIKHFWMKKNN